MTDKHDIENYIRKYALTHILLAELQQCGADFKNTLAEGNLQILYITIEVFEKRGTEMFYKVNKKLRPSLDKLMQTIIEWGKCKTPPNDYYSLIRCLTECRLTTGIAGAINEYLKEINATDFEKKVYNLIEAIKYLSSSYVLDALYERLENKIIDGIYRFIDRLSRNSESKEGSNSHLEKTKKGVYEINHIFQEASKDVKELIKPLLENPEKNIKQFYATIGISEDYRDNRRYFDLYKN
jgi:Asp-tRNA(Asn)/Glu-tRNA(Gln) amidotransferase A subunit family amidase